MRRWLVLLALGIPVQASALDVLVSGSWSVTIGASQLASGAGSDLVDPVTSASGQVHIDIASTASASDAWQVELRRSTAGWPAGVRLWARRSSDGTGPGSISGGNTWQEVTALDSPLFQGQGDRTNVGVELKITGLSVALPPDLHSTSLTYSVIDR